MGAYNLECGRERVLDQGGGAQLGEGRGGANSKGGGGGLSGNLITILGLDRACDRERKSDIERFMLLQGNKPSLPCRMA